MRLNQIEINLIELYDLAVFIIGIPITPLVWQFMAIYREKNARDKQLSQWEEVK